jgi:hypothetical protein
MLIVNFCHVPTTRISEWLPQIAHFNIFVLAHKNANEPAGVLPDCLCGRTPAAVVLSLMAYVIPLLGNANIYVLLAMSQNNVRTVVNILPFK